MYRKCMIISAIMNLLSGVKLLTNKYIVAVYGTQVL